jgi:hypothetical protein
VVGVLGLSVAVAAALRARSGEASEQATPDPALARETPAHFTTTLDVDRFYRGNIHAHSAMTDGDSPAERVFAWYREHGYHFLALTDHNRRLNPNKYLHAERDDFRLLPGEEVTLVAAGVPVHVNALCTTSTIGGRKFSNAGAALEWAVDRIRQQGGVAMINHPNFHWALTVDDIKRVPTAHLLDIFNGHPKVFSNGDATHPSAEATWSSLLASGVAIAPAAVDDMHMLKDEPTERVAPSRPGTGWIEVMASGLDRASLCRALAEGSLYASNGPRIERLRVTPESITLWLDDPGAQVEFIGGDGETLASESLAVDDQSGMYAEYRLRGDELFVRARVTTATGRAWTNAYRTTR